MILKILSNSKLSLSFLSSIEVALKSTKLTRNLSVIVKLQMDTYLSSCRVTLKSRTDISIFFWYNFLERLSPHRNCKFFLHITQHLTFSIICTNFSTSPKESGIDKFPTVFANSDRNHALFVRFPLTGEIQRRVTDAFRSLL